MKPFSDMETNLKFPLLLLTVCAVLFHGQGVAPCAEQATPRRSEAGPPEEFTLVLDCNFMQEAVGLLREKYSRRVCIEDLDFDMVKDCVSLAEAIAQLESIAKTRELSPKEQKRLELALQYRREGKPDDHRFDLALRYKGRFSAASFDGLLTELTKTTPYTWRKIGETYVVCPRAGSLLEYPVTLTTDGLTIVEAVERILDQEPLGPKIGLVWFGKWQGPPGVDPVPWRRAKAPNRRLDRESAMEVLCLVTAATKPDLVWHIAGFKGARQLGLYLSEAARLAEAEALGAASPSATKADSSGTPGAADRPRAEAGTDRPALPAQEPSAGPWPKLGRSPAGRTLLIHSTPKDPRVMAEIEEDLNVMARILEKAVEQQVKPTPVKKLGVVLQSMGQERPQAIHLDGYGALFVLRVRVPLLPSGPAEKVETATAPRRLPWDQTRQELYGGRAGESMPSPEPSIAYDEALVASLKQQLLVALENATHLRHLKPEEHATVTLMGTAGPQGASSPPQPDATPPTDRPFPREGGFRGGAEGGAGFGGGSFGGSVFGGGSFGGSAGGSFRGELHGGVGFGMLDPAYRVGTTLTLRIKKSDADSLAAGKLSAEEFQKKAIIQVYEGNSPGDGAAEFFGWRNGF